MADILLLDNIDSRLLEHNRIGYRTNGHNVVIYRNHIPAQTLIDLWRQCAEKSVLCSPPVGAFPAGGSCMPELLTRLTRQVTVIGIYVPRGIRRLCRNLRRLCRSGGRNPAWQSLSVSMTVRRCSPGWRIRYRSRVIIRWSAVMFLPG